MKKLKVTLRQNGFDVELRSKDLEMALEDAELLAMNPILGFLDGMIVVKRRTPEGGRARNLKVRFFQDISIPEIPTIQEICEHANKLFRLQSGSNPNT